MLLAAGDSVFSSRFSIAKVKTPKGIVAGIMKWLEDTGRSILCFRSMTGLKKIKERAVFLVFVNDKSDIFGNHCCK